MNVHTDRLKYGTTIVIWIGLPLCLAAFGVALFGLVWQRAGIHGWPAFLVTPIIFGEVVGFMYCVGLIVEVFGW